MTISDMRDSIAKTHKELDNRIKDLISSYDSESQCPHLCNALRAVRLADKQSNRAFEIMNDELYLHLES